MALRRHSGAKVGMERETLYAPVEKFGHVQLVLGRTRDLVDPAELLRLLPRLAEHAEDFAVEREFVDAAGNGVGAVEQLGRAGVMQIAHGAPETESGFELAPASRRASRSAACQMARRS